MFVGMIDDSPLCTADTYNEAYRGVCDIAYKLGWLRATTRIWIEEVPHIGGEE